MTAPVSSALGTKHVVLVREVGRCHRCGSSYNRGRCFNPDCAAIETLIEGNTELEHQRDEMLKDDKSFVTFVLAELTTAEVRLLTLRGEIKALDYPSL